MTKVGGYWREAATLIIASKTKPNTVINEVVLDKCNNKKRLIQSDYSILMLKRSGKSKFMPDVHVFPGGVISEEDFSPKWIKIFEGYKCPFSDTVKQFQNRATTAPIFLNRPSSSLVLAGVLPAEVAFRICAIRECFQESGILVARKKKTKTMSYSLVPENYPLSSADLNSGSWRKRVHKDPGQFMVMCEENDLVPDIWALYEWSNWLTPGLQRVSEPPAKPHRFDTLFYVLCVDNLPRVNIDKREAVATQLQSPFALIHQYKANQIRLQGPQFYELSRLCGFTRLEDLQTYVRSREPQGLERWMPVFVLCEDGIVAFMPGDDLYPDDPDYEGTKEVTTYTKTVLELREGSKHQRRSERGPGNKVESYIQRNVTLKCGQVPPVESVFVPEGKL